MSEATKNEIRSATAVVGVFEMVRKLNDCAKGIVENGGPTDILSNEKLEELRDIIQNGISTIFTPKTEAEELEIMKDALIALINGKNKN